MKHVQLVLTLVAVGMVGFLAGRWTGEQGERAAYSILSPRIPSPRQKVAAKVSAIPGKEEWTTGTVNNSQSGVRQASEDAPYGQKEAREYALRLYELTVSSISGSYDYDSDEALEGLCNMHRLNEHVAGALIERYMNGIRGNRDELFAVEYVLVCGGPSVAAFLNDRLNDPTASPLERKRILMALDTAKGWYPSAKIPIDGTLAGTANRLLESNDPLERKAGVTLLGGFKESVEGTAFRLKTVMENDEDVLVRCAAIRSIGRLGTSTARRYIDDFVKTLQFTEYGRNATPDTGERILGAVKYANKQLR